MKVNKWWKSVIVITILAGLILPGCSDTQSNIVNAVELNQDGNFTLYISNQSFAISPVDIKVEINGYVIVDGEFDVENQHNWKEFKLALNPGHYIVHISSTKGAAALMEEFDVTGVHWAVINYWFYPSQHYNPTEKQFSFDYLNRQPAFM